MTSTLPMRSHLSKDEFSPQLACNPSALSLLFSHLVKLALIRIL